MGCYGGVTIKTFTEWHQKRILNEGFYSQRPQAEMEVYRKQTAERLKGWIEQYIDDEYKKQELLNELDTLTIDELNRLHDILVERMPFFKRMLTKANYSLGNILQRLG